MTATALRRLSSVLGLVLLLAGPAHPGLKEGRAEAATAKSGNQKRALEKKKIAKTKAKATQRRVTRKAKAKKASGSLPRPKKADAPATTSVAAAPAIAPAKATTGKKAVTAKKTGKKSTAKKSTAKKTTTAKKATGKDANVPKPETLAANAAAAGNPPSEAAPTTDGAATTSDTGAPAATDSTAAPDTTAPATTTTAPPKKTTAKKTTAKKTTTAKKPITRGTAAPAATTATAMRDSSGAMLTAKGELATAEAELTSARRESKAKSLVKSRLKTKDGPEWDISTPPLQFVGDKSNPVTGSGPIEVIAKQKVQARGFFGRIKQFFSPNAERKFLVLVDNQGAATIISSEAHGLPYRALKTVTSKLPLREYVADMIKSKGAKNGAGLAAGGVGVIAATSASGLGLVLGVGLLVRGIQTYQEGMQRRQVARGKAMEKTVSDIKSAVKGGETVTLSEAYRIYTRDLAGLQENGAVTGGSITPASLREFTEELTTYGL